MGEVFDGRPGKVVELNLIIENGKLIVTAIKSSVSVGDVFHFNRKVFFHKAFYRISKGPIRFQAPSSSQGAYLHILPFPQRYKLLCEKLQLL